MLENQQLQLVTGLQELYKRTQKGQGWVGSPLKETSHGAPLTHDILERLGALKQDGHTMGDVFEEDLNLMQQRLISSGAGLMPRDLSSDSDSEAVESPMFDQMSQKPPLFTDPFSLNSFPPTPPNHSPYPQTARTVPSKMQSYPQLHRDQIGLNPLLQQRQTWGPASEAFDDNMNMDMEFVTGFDPSSSYGVSTPLFGQFQAPVGTMNPSLSMRFPEDDYINPGLL